jgi:hypothetical protein|tara:strand:+ start:387 stop:677 length:291 start_codon:yes stop_codon:yes gene_type:complete
MALVTTKNDPDAPLLEAVRIAPEPVDADEPNGTQYEYGLVLGVTEPAKAKKATKTSEAVEASDGGEQIIDAKFTKSGFYRLYSPFQLGDAKELKEV